jgi:chorismate dehydratase
LEELGGKTIAVSSESDTSVALLKIILKEFLSLKCKFKTVKFRTLKSGLSSFPAFLLIGDSAMKEARKRTAPHVYDLAELWHKHTRLPFVFALWIVRKETVSEKRELLNKLSSDLIKANKYAQKQFPLIAKKTSQKEWLTEEGLVNYWKKISYNLTEKHMEGLRLFEKYLERI